MPPKKFMIMFSNREDVRRASHVLALDGNLPFKLDLKYYAIWTDKRDDTVNLLRNCKIEVMEVLDMLG